MDRQELQSVLRRHDSISYVEDQLFRDPTYFVEVSTNLCSSITDTRWFSHQLYNEPSGLFDTELGYATLPLELLSHPPLVSTFYTQDHSFAQEVIALSRCGSQVESEVLFSRPELSIGRLDEDRFTFSTQLLDVLFRCLKPMPCLNDSSVLFTDYLPWIRYMVNVDNALEELISPPSTQQRRQTRTSKRAAHERHIPLEVAQLEVLSKTAFCVDPDPDDE